MLRTGIALLALAAMPALAGDLRGVGNFHEVNGELYRGAQPTAEGFRNLAKLGVKTVVDLRGSEHSIADEKRVVEADGMRYVSIPMRGFRTPTRGQIGAALKVLDDPKAGPVFVHCRRGADRTGAVIACYRIAHDKWDNARALHEASGCGMSPFQLAIRSFVRHFSAASAH
ncbi:MAG: tyrosine-protein phosphatase [Acidobacteriota bacterium]|nr:tyrosine-protein phosphatase [Acidobacteriota bacterium]